MQRSDCDYCVAKWRSSRVWRFGGASVAIGWLSRSGRAPRQIRRAFSASILSGHSFVITFFCLTSQVFALPADHIHVVAVSGLVVAFFQPQLVSQQARQAADHAGAVLQCQLPGLLLSCSFQFDPLLCAHKLRTAAERNQPNSQTPSHIVPL